jgi:hypothetical protein
MHSDGRVEVVELREKCGERDEGGAAFEVFVPSSEREAETRCQGLELYFCLSAVAYFLLSPAPPAAAGALMEHCAATAVAGSALRMVHRVNGWQGSLSFTVHVVFTPLNFFVRVIV